MQYNRGLFVFRQDLRIYDNTGLYNAAKSCKELICLFVFDETILLQSPQKDKRLGFLIDAIKQLDKQLQTLGSRLYVDIGVPEQIIPERIIKHNCDCVLYNNSYGPRSKTRDYRISDRCTKHNILCKGYDDFLMLAPGTIDCRKVFTPFYNLRKKQVFMTYPELCHGTYKPTPINTIKTPIINRNNNRVYSSIDAGENTHRPIHWARERIQQFDLSHYEQYRNMLDCDGTTRLSPYMRFGLLSIRELFAWGIASHKNHYGIQADTQKNHYISELAWREFRYHIMHYFPDTATTAFQEKRRHIQWITDEKLLHKRTIGETGYPIVDAAMKQLITENWMHGRARMIVASFLTKDMLIDWRLGEYIFSQYLLDYDFAVNIGNRQWSASIGADPKPLRIFNPLLQSKKFDPQCVYIKKYLPGLNTQSIKAIHDPISYTLDYIPPIVNHYTASQSAKLAYRQ